jgi:hypothetical protein
MTTLTTILATAGAVLVLAAPAAFAADRAELPLAEKPQASVQKLVRYETLELPGVTACHQCEWRPHPHEQAAADQCGLAADGTPRIGQFECGFSPACERVCNFVTCAP